MKTVFFIIFYVLLLFSSIDVFAQQSKTPAEAIEELKAKLNKDKTNKNYLLQLTELLINRGDYNQTIYFANQLDRIAKETNDERAEMYASIYLGQALLMTGAKQDAQFYMEKSLRQATALRNDSALSSVYNGLGLYASNVEMDYYKSIHYFHQGLEAAKRSSHKRLYSLLISNISGIYYLKKDAGGLKYALECYDLGHETEDAYLIYSSAVNCAYMYYLLKNYSEALRYIKEAEFVMEKNDFYDKSNVYNLYGNILSGSGEDQAAMQMFNKALKYQDKSQASSVVNTYLSFAKVLMQKQQYEEAIRLLNKGLVLSREKDNNIFLFDLYECLSQVYEEQGDLENSLKYYKVFHHLSDSMFNMDKERSLSELNVKYQTERRENEIQKGKLAIVEKEKKEQALLAVLFLIIALLASSYYLHYRKHKLYKKIVRQNKEAVKRESHLQKQIEQLLNGGKKPDLHEKYAVSSLTDEKGRRLFEALQSLMREQHIYRQRDLTKDKLADLLSTNRTYLSQVINEQTGMSYTHYINAFRIEEAVRILSDTENTIPLKALASELGFNSITTFYKAFQQIIGMTPSTYRSTMEDLNQKV